MNTYPNQPGYKVSGTSEDAAAAIAEHAPTLRQRVLDIFATREWTADEAAEHLGESVLSVRPRLSELNRMGLIVQTGHRRINNSGMSANVWKRATFLPVTQPELFA